MVLLLLTKDLPLPPKGPAHAHVQVRGACAVLPCVCRAAVRVRQAGAPSVRAHMDAGIARLHTRAHAPPQVVLLHCTALTRALTALPPQIVLYYTDVRTRELVARVACARLSVVPTIHQVCGCGGCGGCGMQLRQRCQHCHHCTAASTAATTSPCSTGRQQQRACASPPAPHPSHHVPCLTPLTLPTPPQLLRAVHVRTAAVVASKQLAAAACKAGAPADASKLEGAALAAGAQLALVAARLGSELKVRVLAQWVVVGRWRWAERCSGQ